VILSLPDWLIVWHGPEATLRGFTGIGAELAGKRLELVKETIPRLSRVAVLWNPEMQPLRNHGKKANWLHEN
jgi:hypothetical protein